MPAPIVKQGARYGRLLVICLERKDANGARVWRCFCRCGTLVAVRAHSLSSGVTRSCGCMRDEKSAIRLGAQRRKVAS